MLLREALLNQRLRDQKHLHSLPHLSSYFPRVSLGYFVDKEQNYDVSKSKIRQPLASTGSEFYFTYQALEMPHQLYCGHRTYCRPCLSRADGLQCLELQW